MVKLHNNLAQCLRFRRNLVKEYSQWVYHCISHDLKTRNLGTIYYTFYVPSHPPIYKCLKMCTPALGNFRFFVFTDFLSLRIFQARWLCVSLFGSSDLAQFGTLYMQININHDKHKYFFVFLSAYTWAWWKPEDNTDDVQHWWEFKKQTCTAGRCGKPFFQHAFQSLNNIWIFDSKIPNLETYPKEIRSYNKILLHWLF